MLFLFRSAPKVEKRIHSKFFRKFWEEPGYKRTDLHYCITEPSNDDYDNGVSDNCDQNFGTFDDFVLKMTKKYHIT